jgi:hypothetical protein
MPSNPRRQTRVARAGLNDARAAGKTRAAVRSPTGIDGIAPERPYVGT